MKLGPVDISRKSGAESFHQNGEPFEFDVLGFWQWSASKLLTNAQRGVLAEYLVAKATGAASDIRNSWDAFDLSTPEGIKIEVKSAAYIQSWHQDEYSRISFDISGSQSWDSETNVMQKETRRHSDVYVFCLLHHKDQETIDPTDLDQWTFYMLSASELDEKLPDQKSIGLKGLMKVEAREAQYEELEAAVREAHERNGSA